MGPGNDQQEMATDDDGRAIALFGLVGVAGPARAAVRAAGDAQATELAARMLATSDLPAGFVSTSR
jgi:hypothetical protein